MMKCDKCKKEERNMETIRMGGVNVHLCLNCIYELKKEWKVQDE